MGQKLLYGLLYGMIKAFAILPIQVLYLFSDALYFFIYRVVNYRRKVVRGNLRHVFPEKTEQERRRIERKFYHHFADYIVETIKLAHISQEELLRRAHLRNPEMIQPLLAHGHTCIMLVMGHYGNWEWFTGFQSCFGGEVQVHSIYRPLTNRAFDRLFLALRTRFHALGIRKKDAFREIFRLRQSRIPGLVVFIADQTPSKANLHYWTTFLHQESAMLTGPERIAVKLDLPVIFVDVRKIKRGYYTVDFELLTDRPKDMPEFWITEEYTRRMERCILRDPAYWLWTHKRWKYKKIQNP
ncbi:MAG: lysophospholipid acyltransferase family protein [Tannerella sp.]|jgi:KDO2-lipid IV(A) lauroyltransferase|nr:lysophospholipid acyltransferase family protein [Tannerella sp.]